MTRGQLEQIIFEELEAYFSNMNITETEEFLSLAENDLFEKAKEKKKRPKYTSVGTVPTIKGRTMTPAQVDTRKSLGRTLLRAVQWGTIETNPVKKALVNHAKSKGYEISDSPADQKKMYSFIWATASNHAIEGTPLPKYVVRAAEGPFKKTGGLGQRKNVNVKQDKETGAVTKARGAKKEKERAKERGRPSSVLPKSTPIEVPIDTTPSRRYSLGPRGGKGSYKYIDPVARVAKIRKADAERRAKAAAGSPSAPKSNKPKKATPTASTNKPQPKITAAKSSKPKKAKFAASTRKKRPKITAGKVKKLKETVYRIHSLLQEMATKNKAAALTEATTMYTALSSASHTTHSREFLKEFLQEMITKYGDQS